ncbi:MAG: flagellar basal body P-ring protein FlgI [Planctomycetota bacterium]
MKKTVDPGKTVQDSTQAFPPRPNRRNCPRPLRLLPRVALLLFPLLSACPAGVDEIRERDAEKVFVRGTTIAFHETQQIVGKIGDFAKFAEGKRITLTGVGVVVDLSKTGDKGQDFKKLQAFLATLPDLRAPAGTRFEEGEVALVGVESQISPWLGTSAGLVGASIRPLGNAESLEGGMLLETNLVLPVTGEVYAVAAGPVLTSRTDAEGNPIKTPKFGRIMKIQVKGRHRPGETRELIVAPVWPGFLQSIAKNIEEGFPALKVKTSPPGKIQLILPDDPFALPGDFPVQILNRPVKATSEGLSLIFCDEKGKGFYVLGNRIFLGRGTFLLGGGIKVVSFAPRGPPRAPTSSTDESEETDLAVVEVTLKEGKRRIVTLRWMRHVIRVLDRLGVTYAETKRLMQMAVEMGVLGAEILPLPPERLDFLKGWAQKVR